MEEKFYEIIEIVRKEKKKLIEDSGRVVTSVAVPQKLYNFCRERNIYLGDLAVLGYIVLNDKLKENLLNIDLFSKAILYKIINRKVYMLSMQTAAKINNLKNNELEFLRHYLNYAKANNVSFIILTDEEIEKIKEVLKINDLKDLLEEFEKNLKEI